jgi:hypothetical protein
MPAAGLIILGLGALLGGGAAAAAAARRRQAESAPSSTRQVELDPDLPPSHLAQVLGALARERSPDKLEELARQMDALSHHLTASALRERAKELAVLPARPTSEPEALPPAPAAVAAPTQPPQALEPAAAPLRDVAMASAPSPAPDLDSGMDAATHAAVLRALVTDNDPKHLSDFAESIRPQYPVASSLLFAKARALGSVTVPAATTGPGGLDPTLDTATRAAVLQALVTETDPARLVSFAATLQEQFPIAAGMVLGRAQELQRRAPPYAAPATSPAAAAAPSPAGPTAPRSPGSPGRPRPLPPGPRAAPSAEPSPRAAPAAPASVNPWAAGADITPKMSDDVAQDFLFALGTWLLASPALHDPSTSDLDFSWWSAEHRESAGPHAEPRPRPVPPSPRPAPRPAVPSAFPLVAGATFVDDTRALRAARRGFSTPVSWPPEMTTQAENIHRSASAPRGVYYVYFAADGALYRFTKSATNTVLAVSHDVDAALLGAPASSPAPASRLPDAPSAAAARPRPPPSAPAPAPLPAPAAPSTAPVPAAVCPFPVQPGVVCIGAQDAMAQASTPFSVPRSWPPAMTAQATAINAATAASPGIYYVVNPGDGNLYKFTKSKGAQGRITTTLQSAKATSPTAFATSGESFSPRAALEPAPALRALGDQTHWTAAVTALQRHARAHGYAHPPGLPGTHEGVLDAQTYLTLIDWLTASGRADVAEGRGASAAWGAQRGALPAFTAQVRGAAAAASSAAVLARVRPSPPKINLQARG